MRKITQTISDEDAIKKRIGEGKMSSIGADNAVLPSSASPFEHGNGQVNSDRTRSRRILRDKMRKISGAAGQIENHGILRQRSVKYRVAFPSAVHSPGKGAGDEVVSRRNSAEHAAHEVRILFFRWRFHSVGLYQARRSGCGQFERGAMNSLCPDEPNGVRDLTFHARAAIFIGFTL